MTSNQHKRLLWQRVIDPDDPLLWAGRLSVASIAISALAIMISLAWG